jgi:hypothetical protein
MLQAAGWRATRAQAFPLNSKLDCIWLQTRAACFVARLIYDRRAPIVFDEKHRSEV